MGSFATQTEVFESIEEKDEAVGSRQTGRGEEFFRGWTAGALRVQVIGLPRCKWEEVHCSGG